MPVRLGAEPVNNLLSVEFIHPTPETRVAHATRRRQVLLPSFAFYLFLPRCLQHSGHAAALSVTNHHGTNLSPRKAAYLQYSAKRIWFNLECRLRLNICFMWRILHSCTLTSSSTQVQVMHNNFNPSTGFGFLNNFADEKQRCRR